MSTLYSTPPWPWRRYTNPCHVYIIQIPPLQPTTPSFQHNDRFRLLMHDIMRIKNAFNDLTTCQNDYTSYLVVYNKIRGTYSKAAEFPFVHRAEGRVQCIWKQHEP